MKKDKQNYSCPYRRNSGTRQSFDESEYRVMSKEHNQLLDKIEHELMNGKLRDEFEDLFPKDQEAIDGIRPSKSRRSTALLYHALIISYLRSLRE